MVGEVLPSLANSVTHAEEKDEYGLPRPMVTFSYSDNDRKMIANAISQMQEIFQAAGGKPEYVVPDSAHLMGGCRMGNNPETSVVDPWGRSHDHENLYLAGAPLFVTGGGTNPTETVMALAARTADYIIQQSKQGFLGRREPVKEPICR